MDIQPIHSLYANRISYGSDYPFLYHDRRDWMMTTALRKMKNTIALADALAAQSEEYAIKIQKLEAKIQELETKNAELEAKNASIPQVLIKLVNKK